MKTTRKQRSGSRLTPLCRTPELAVDEERALFMQLQTMKRHRTLHREFERIRNRIAAANLRLVIAMARPFVTPQMPLDELVSAGMLPLLRAVELFDPSRGFRFSTYATHAVRNYLLRVRKQTARRSARETGTASDIIETLSGRVSPTEGADLILQEECRALRSAVRALPERDQRLIAFRFGLDGEQVSRTFKELATLLGLSRERVRVLTHRALNRLRDTLDDKMRGTPISTGCFFQRPIDENSSDRQQWACRVEAHPVSRNRWA